MRYFLKIQLLLSMLGGVAFANEYPVVYPQQLKTTFNDASTMRILGKPIMDRHSHLAIALQCLGVECTHFQPVLISGQGAQAFGGIYKNDSRDILRMQYDYRHSAHPLSMFEDEITLKKIWWKRAIFSDRLQKLTIQNGWNWSIDSEKVSATHFNRLFNFLFSYSCCTIRQDGIATYVSIPNYLRRPFSNGVTVTGSSIEDNRTYLLEDVRYWVSTDTCNGVADFIYFSAVTPFSDIGAEVTYHK